MAIEYENGRAVRYKNSPEQQARIREIMDMHDMSERAAQAFQDNLDINVNRKEWLPEDINRDLHMFKMMFPKERKSNFIPGTMENETQEDRNSLQQLIRSVTDVNQ